LSKKKFNKAVKVSEKEMESFMSTLQN